MKSLLRGKCLLFGKKNGGQLEKNGNWIFGQSVIIDIDCG